MSNMNGDDLGEEVSNFFDIPTQKQLLEKCWEQEKAISEMDHAIVMLKKYVLDNGLKPFWEPSNRKSVRDMTPTEVIEANASIAERIRPRASTNSAAAIPSLEERKRMIEEDADDRTKQIRELVRKIMKVE